ncbi:hypothetical protein GCM10025331_75550 [Actinoplanes utahensis]|nr:hypothetical protein Aut01nite_67280 [Actinoplanes utahensis]
MTGLVEAAGSLDAAPVGDVLVAAEVAGAVGVAGVLADAEVAGAGVAVAEAGGLVAAPAGCAKPSTCCGPPAQAAAARAVPRRTAEILIMRMRLSYPPAASRHQVGCAPGAASSAIWVTER